MTWQNPWALAGLATLALPVLIHLLSRTQARVQPFPTLRFLDVSRLLPTRSPHITDVPLLLVRIGIFAAAVIALAGPLFGGAANTRAPNSSLARAIIVDTSFSVRGGSTTNADSLSARATAFASTAATSITLQTADVGASIKGAVVWLDTQPGRGEVVVLSDFQASSVDSADLANIPKYYQLTLVRAAQINASISQDSAPINNMQSQTTAVEITSEPARTVAEWSLPPTDAGDKATVTTSRADASVPGASADANSALVGNGLLLVTADRDSAGGEAAKRAALQILAPPRSDTAIAVAIVYPGAPAFALLVSSAKPLNKAWMGTVIQRLQSSELFQSAIAGADAATDTLLPAPFFVLGRNRNGCAVVYAARAMVGGRERLVLYARMNAGSVESAALIGAAVSASGVPWNASEHETRTLSDATLASLQHDATVVAPGHSSTGTDSATNASDARWLWTIALVLLAVEWYVRREKRSGARATAVLENAA